jgi:hypothetical protein
MKENILIIFPKKSIYIYIYIYIRDENESPSGVKLVLKVTGVEF